MSPTWTYPGNAPLMPRLTDMPATPSDKALVPFVSVEHMPALVHSD